jgi:glucose-1-phosphate thymidylyltransferase
MKGQSHALWLAREHLLGPALICFSDTLMDADFSFLDDESADAVVWAKLVEDPRRFGVAELGPDGWVRRFIEKPRSTENKLAVVGCYYFKRAESLSAAIKEQMERDVSQNGEYYLADAISIMIDHGAQVRIQEVRAWLDTGTPEATLETNRWLLDRTRLEAPARDGVTIIPPVAIHPTARIMDSTIGPYASIGADCSIRSSHVEASILEPGAELHDVALKNSLVGSRASVRGMGLGQQLRLNVGDDCSVVIE